MRRFPAGVARGHRGRRRAAVRASPSARSSRCRSSRARRRLDRAAVVDATSRCATPDGSRSACSPATRTALAQHFARSVPPLVAWDGVAAARVELPEPLHRRRARLARVPPSPSTTSATTRSSSARSTRSSSAATGAALALRPRRVRAGVIDAVVFDLDGVLLDSEQLWDEVREELARERGGRWHDGRAAGHDGHELAGVVALHARRASGCAEPPEEINRLVVERMLARYRREPAAAPGRGRGGRAAGARGGRSGWRRRRTGR